MGVDLFAIAGHNFNYQQIIQLQDRIETDHKLRELYWWSEYKSTRWHVIADEERLMQSWKHNMEQIEVDEVFFYDDLYFPAFFGDIRFHSNIIQLPGFGLKLWTMENDSELRRKILFFYERLAQLIGQRSIIYYGDSWAKSSWIQELVYDKSISDIITQVNLKHRNYTKDIDKSIAEEHLYIQRI